MNLSTHPTLRVLQRVLTSAGASRVLPKIRASIFSVSTGGD